jgi:hypothetical protein
LKLISFVAGAVVLLAAARDRRLDIADWRDWLVCIHLCVLCLSAPLLASPAGYTVVQTSFQGILVHPQSFGVFLIAVTTYLSVGLITAELRGFPVVLGAGLGWPMIVLTNARTCIVAFACALLVLGAVGILRRGALAPRLSHQRRVLWSTAALIVATLVFGANTTEAGNRVFGFLAKSNARLHGAGLAELSTRGFQASRGRLISECLDAFHDAPLTGVGFGLACVPEKQQVARDGAFGVPVSAAIEQGFLPTAILGQAGLPGAILLSLMIAAVFGPAIARCTAPVIALAVTAFAVNIGEMIFFAMGGLGLQMWTILALSHESAIRIGNVPRSRTPRVLAQHVEPAPIRPHP